MSNFKEKLAHIRKEKRRLIAAETIQPAQSTVTEDSDMSGYTSKIEEALKITIYPTSIDGFVESFSGQLNVTMSNSDELELIYDIDEETNTSSNSLTINGQSVSLQPNFDPSQLTGVYKQFLGM